MSNVKEDIQKEKENTPSPEQKINEYSQGASLKSRVSRLVNKEYSNGGTTLTRGNIQLGTLGVTGPSAWNEADFYKDDKGYSAVITHDSYDHAPLEIRIRIPGENEETAFVINRHTIMNHDNANAIEADRAIKKFEKKIKKGASLEEIIQDFAQYQRREYPENIAQTVKTQEDINTEFRKKVNKMRSKASYGTCMADTSSNRFDPYKQKYYQGAPTLYCTQTNRDTSGDISADITETYSAYLTYNDLSTDIKEIIISHPNYKTGQVGFTEYNEKLTVDTLVAQGYTPEAAQKKLNEVAERIFNGENLKQLFFDNRQFMTKESAELLKKDMADWNEKNKPSSTLRNNSLEKN